MDEILIEEKKYVSSKRAAKITGYAKDYVGQLCREGRVPARLVGRSWYVLESAIHDHRFGKQRIEQDTQAAPVSGLLKRNLAPVFQSTWESPRYEASLGEVLPSVNRLRPVESSVEPEVAQHLEDSWKAWFDRVADTEPVALATLAVPPEEKQEEDEEEPEIAEKIEEEEIHIPVHTVYELPPEDLLPRLRPEARPQGEVREAQTRRGGGRGTIRAIQVAGAVLAILMATVAVVGTGYFDKYILSDSRVGLIAGVALYNR